MPDAPKRRKQRGVTGPHGELPATATTVRGGAAESPLLDPAASPAVQCRRGNETYGRTLALATLAHEIKNPLAIVSGYLDLLLTQKAGPLNDRQRDILVDARANCTRLQKLAQDFLAYSSLATGKAALALHFEMGDLNVCLTEVCGYWMERFAAKSVALYFQANPEIPRLRFDFFKLQQVVSNLLENSLKFTPAGGAVWLTAELCDGELRRAATEPLSPHDASGVLLEGPSVQVTVADSGKGIAPEYHQEIFDDFFRVPGEAKETAGAGLGLAIARRLIDMHGGRIWVESEEGNGSRFCFVLPLSSR